MSDRAFQIGIGLSLALHVAAAIALSGPRSATPIVRPPAQAASVRVRLARPPVEPARSAPPPAVAAPPSPRERERPERIEKKIERPKPEARPILEQPSVPERAAAEPVDAAAQMLATAAQTLDAAARARDAEDVASDAGVPGPAPVAELPDARPTHADDPSRLARYVEEVRARIEARKRYPAMARKRSVEGRVVARVEIRADGRVAAIAFDAGAPPLLRRATDEAIRSAAPYPAPPAGAMTIELPVDYALRDAS